MAIRIDHIKTHLPLSKIKGTAQARLNQTIKMSDNFFENVKGSFGYQNISTGILSNIFKKSLNPEIEVKVFGKPRAVNESSTDLAFNGGGVKAETIGYEVILPVEPYKQRIEKSSIKLIMKEAFGIFYKVTNPKILQREINIVNKRYDLTNLAALLKEKGLNSKKINEFDIDKLLAGRKVQEKVDLLQSLRNYLKQQFYMLENNAKYQLRNGKISKLKRTTIIHKPHTSFNLPEKIEVVENKLAQIMKNERDRMAKS